MISFNINMVREFSVEVPSSYSDDDYMKDCPTYNKIPTILPASERIIAIGDIHGDLDLAIESFRIAGLIDDNLDWIADPPNTVVVQVGDQIDSCRPIPGHDCHRTNTPGDNAEDIKILKFFDEMHVKANKYGGAVYSLLGNHEIMNAEGNFEYVSYKNYHEFYHEDEERSYKGPKGRQEAFRPGGPLATNLACSRNAVIIIGSNMFIHAGILPRLAQILPGKNMSEREKLSHINRIVRKWLLNKVIPENYKNTIVKAGSISPFWTRIFGKIPKNESLNSEVCMTNVKQVLKIFQIGHIVVGHTPQLFTNGDGVNGTCHENGENKLYRVDGGFSRAFKIFDDNNIVQVLEILNDTTFNVIKGTLKSQQISSLDKINVNIREF